MLDLESHAEGTILRVRAQAGARRAGIRGVRGGMLKVGVTEVPEKGKANRALVAVLSEELSLARSQLELLSGATSPDKRFLVRGTGREELAGRIAAVLARPAPGCRSGD